MDLSGVPVRCYAYSTGRPPRDRCLAHAQTVRVQAEAGLEAESGSTNECGGEQVAVRVVARAAEAEEH